jgi:cobalamin biosynthesis protein CbiD
MEQTHIMKRAPGEASMEVIKAVDLNFTYPDGTAALTGINLCVGSGERVAVLGANGSGKSTLFHHFNGLLQPSSGEVFVKEMRVEKQNYRAIRRMVGMVFQDPDDQLFSNTVRQEISYGLLNLGTPREAIPAAIKWSLSVVGLEGYEDKSPYLLSGGEKKRVALASVLAMKPEVLVLDEPTSSLDPRGVAQLVRLLNSINGELKITLVFATHDVDVVPLLADRVYVLNKGRIRISGTTAEVFSRKKAIRDNNLRLPRVAHLVELLQRDGFAPSGERPEGSDDGRAAGAQHGQPEVVNPGSCQDKGANHPEVSAGSVTRPGELPMTIGQARRLLEAMGASDAPRLMPGMYRLHDGRMLRRGYTTGTCAAAAARAAALALLGQNPATVNVRLPGGGEAALPVAGTVLQGDSAQAWVIKDAGDDPDVTDGAEIRATVRLQPQGITVRGGSGVGVVTRPGLAVSPNQPAINPVPLQMIKENLAAVLPAGGGAEVTISVPEGERLARRTMNSHLGIVGGISILGTTGIVEPMSEESFKQALAPQLDIARAAGQQVAVLTPGRRGASLAAEFGIPRDAVVLISNYAGFMLEECVRQGFRQAVLWGHVGKLAKVAAGSFQTYNRIADGRAEVVAALAAARGAGADLIRAILEAATAEVMVEILKDAGLERVWHDLARRASSRAVTYTRGGLTVGTVLFSYRGSPIGWDDNALLLLKKAGWHAVLTEKPACKSRPAFCAEREDSS